MGRLTWGNEGVTIDSYVPAMLIPTEPIGSIPRPVPLIEAIKTTGSTDPALDPLFEEAIRDTIERFEATGHLGAK